MFVLIGDTDDTSNWTVTPTATNVTFSKVGNVFTITDLTNDVGYLDLVATKSGYTTQTKRMTLAKAKVGEDGANGDNGLSTAVVFIYQRDFFGAFPT